MRNSAGNRIPHTFATLLLPYSRITRCVMVIPQTSRPPRQEWQKSARYCQENKVTASKDEKDQRQTINPTLETKLY